MRFVTKSEAVKESFLKDLRDAGIKFELQEVAGYEAFVGYALEGTLEEINSMINVIEGADREALKEGFLSFKESLNHLLEHLKAEERFETLIREGPWVAELLDQLARNGALEYGDGTVRLKEGIDVTNLRFEFKFPFNLVHSPENTERIAKQFVLTELTMEYRFEILELDMGRINSLGEIAARYFPEDQLLKVYFALIGRSILAGEILKALGEGKMPEEDLINGFLRASPISIPTQKGTLVISYSKRAFEEVLRFLKRAGYVEMKGGKVRKLRDLT